MLLKSEFEVNPPIPTCMQEALLVAMRERVMITLQRKKTVPTFMVDFNKDAPWFHALYQFL